MHLGMSFTCVTNSGESFVYGTWRARTVISVTGTVSYDCEVAALGAHERLDKCWSIVWYTDSHGIQPIRYIWTDIDMMVS